MYSFDRELRGPRCEYSLGRFNTIFNHVTRAYNIIKILYYMRTSCSPKRFYVVVFSFFFVFTFLCTIIQCIWLFSVYSRRPAASFPRIFCLLLLTVLQCTHYAYYIIYYTYIIYVSTVHVNYIIRYNNNNMHVTHRHVTNKKKNNTYSYDCLRSSIT